MSDRRLSVTEEPKTIEIRQCNVPLRTAVNLAGNAAALMGVIYLNKVYVGHWLVDLWAFALSILMFGAIGYYATKRAKGEIRRVSVDELRAWLDQKYGKV